MLALTAACGGAAIEEPVEPTGDRCSDAVIALAVGEARTLAGATAQCIVFADANAGYALAYADGRWEVEARTAFERASQLPEFTVAIESGRPASAPSSLVQASPRRRDATPHLSPAAATSDECAAPHPDDIFCRAEPWREGERFVPKVNTGFLWHGDPDMVVEVVAVREPFVIAVDVGLLPVSRDALVAIADSVIDGFFPLLRGSMTETQPVTSRGSGQIFVAVAGVHGVASVGTLPFGMRGYIRLAPSIMNATTLGHELAHLWHGQYLHDTRASASDTATTAPYWAEEGAASFAELEVMRRRLGLPRDANACVPPRVTPLGEYLKLMRSVDGTTEEGYWQGAAFLHHLVGRAIAAGADPDEAHREVVRGALEGLHGHGLLGKPGREGLTSRMRRLVDPAWDATDALANWAASAALDDRNPGTRYQHPTLCRAWDLDNYPGWPADGEVTIGQSGHASVTRRAGSAGYFMLQPGAVNGRLKLKASSDAIRWLLVRYR